MNIAVGTEHLYKFKHDLFLIIIKTETTTIIAIAKLIRQMKRIIRNVFITC